MICLGLVVTKDNAHITGTILILLFITSVHLLTDYLKNKDHSLKDHKTISQTVELVHLKKQNILLAKELNFLKSQFNAHILFNFLNFCYSKVHKNSTVAAEAIEAFSDMLRYSLQLKPDQPVPLKKEIEYLENYICIQKCLTAMVCIDFTYDGTIHEKTILPGILVTFVEKAFKHGEINNEFFPIEIHLFADPDQIIFQVKNRKDPAKRIEDMNSTHQTVKDMLDHFYQGCYKLEVKNKDMEYVSELTINCT